MTGPAYVTIQYVSPGWAVVLSSRRVSNCSPEDKIMAGRKTKVKKTSFKKNLCMNMIEEASCINSICRTMC